MYILVHILIWFFSNFSVRLFCLNTIYMSKYSGNIYFLYLKKGKFLFLYYKKYLNYFCITKILSQILSHVLQKYICQNAIQYNITKCNLQLKIILILKNLQIYKIFFIRIERRKTENDNNFRWISLSKQHSWILSFQQWMFNLIIFNLWKLRLV